MKMINYYPRESYCIVKKSKTCETMNRQSYELDQADINTFTEHPFLMNKKDQNNNQQQKCQNQLANQTKTTERLLLADDQEQQRKQNQTKMSETRTQIKLENMIPVSEIKVEKMDAFDIDSLVETIKRKNDHVEINNNLDNIDMLVTTINKDYSKSSQKSPSKKVLLPEKILSHDVIIKLEQLPEIEGRLNCETSLTSVLQRTTDVKSEILPDLDEWGEFREFNVDSLLDVARRKDKQGKDAYNTSGRLDNDIGSLINVINPKEHLVSNTVACSVSTNSVVELLATESEHISKLPLHISNISRIGMKSPRVVLKKLDDKLFSSNKRDYSWNVTDKGDNSWNVSKKGDNSWDVSEKGDNSWNASKKGDYSWNVSEKGDYLAVNTTDEVRNSLKNCTVLLDKEASDAIHCAGSDEQKPHIKRKIGSENAQSKSETEASSSVKRPKIGPKSKIQRDEKSTVVKKTSKFVLNKKTKTLFLNFKRLPEEKLKAFSNKEKENKCRTRKEDENHGDSVQSTSVSGDNCGINERMEKHNTDSDLETMNQKVGGENKNVNDKSQSITKRKSSRIEFETMKHKLDSENKNLDDKSQSISEKHSSDYDKCKASQEKDGHSPPQKKVKISRGKKHKIMYTSKAAIIVDNSKKAVKKEKKSVDKGKITDDNSKQSTRTNNYANTCSKGKSKSLAKLDKDTKTKTKSLTSGEDDKKKSKEKIKIDGHENTKEMKEKKMKIPTTKCFYRCQTCSKSFESNTEYVLHIKTHENECTLCKKIFKSVQAFISHMKIHKGVQCHICDKYFTSKKELVVHSKMHNVHNREIDQNQSPISVDLEVTENSLQVQKQMFPCLKCSKMFTSVSDFDNHKKAHLNSSSQDSFVRESLFPCNQCSGLFMKREDLLKHVKVHEEKQPIHKCDVCYKEFDNETYLTNHKKVHIGHETLKCSVCFLSFHSSSDLEEHTNMHKNEEKYKCDICFKVYRNILGLEEHRESVHNIYSKKCTKCGKKIPSSDEFKTHLSSKCESNHMTCEICHQVFTLRFELEEHIDCHEKNREIECSICSRKFDNIEQLVDHKDKHLQCMICFRRFTEENILFEHQKVHYGKNCPQCRICSKCFPSEWKLQEHEKKEHPFEILICDICQSSFKTILELKEHMTTHQQESYKCSKCSDSFQSKTELSQHWKNDHNKGMNFMCGLCKIPFMTEKELTSHVSNCHDKVQYKCGICNQTFSSENKLTDHMPSHTAQYQCGICKKAFPQETELISHLNEHTMITTDVSCDQCDEKFKTQNDLDQHVSSSHMVEEFQCGYCQRFFSTNDTLVQHVVTHMATPGYNCDTCGEVFKSKEEFEKHHHGSDKGKNLKCRICLFVGLTRNSLMKHLEQHL